LDAYFAAAGLSAAAGLHRLAAVGRHGQSALVVSENIAVWKDYLRST